MQQHTAGPVGPVTPPVIKRPETFYPPDFCGNKDLELSAFWHPNNPDIEPHVVLCARGAGCTFQWSLTPEGARRMAQMLGESAAEADRMALDLSTALAAA